MTRGARVRLVFVLIGTLFFLAGLTACLFLTAPGLFGLSVYRVSTSSMAPSIPAGSAVYILDGSDSAIGDVVVYRDASGNEVLHRIVGENLDGYLILKGDANRVSDPAPVSGDQISGRMFVSIYGPELFNGLLSLLSALSLCAGLSFILIGWSVGRPAGKISSRDARGRVDML